LTSVPRATELALVASVEPHERKCAITEHCCLSFATYSRESSTPNGCTSAEGTANEMAEIDLRSIAEDVRAGFHVDGANEV